MVAAAPRAATAAWVNACFHVMPDGRRKCKVCGQMYQKDTGSSNLRVHMWGTRDHPPYAEVHDVPKSKATIQKEERQRLQRERLRELSMEQQESDEMGDHSDVQVFSPPTSSLPTPPPLPSSSTASIRSFLTSSCSSSLSSSASSCSSSSNSSVASTGSGNKRVYGQQPFRLCLAQGRAPPVLEDC
jgi:hypothetical protein